MTRHAVTRIFSVAISLCVSSSRPPPSPSLSRPYNTMSLLTPPSSSHRSDKENRFVVEPRPRSVLWVDKHEIHSLSTPLKTVTISSKERPATTRSILKKSDNNSMLALPVGMKQRECTPEPREILTNSDYLTRPLSQIISIDDPNSPTTLSGLIEGYNVLAARLRSGVTESADVDSTWALFEPLRKNTDAFVDAIVRDLGRAFVDPISIIPNNEDDSVPKFSLPSPQKSPVKKKGGMTGEQVKFARDLCTTCHSVIRLLGVILSLPALYNLFEGQSKWFICCTISYSYKFRKATASHPQCDIGHSIGRRSTNAKLTQNLCIGNLVNPSSATSPTCPKTRCRPHRLCVTSGHRRRTRKRGQERICERWFEGAYNHHS